MLVNRKKLKSYMVKNCLTMRELSEKAGLGANWVGTFMCGQTKTARPSTVGKLCKALNCEPEDICDIED